jgi:hypothetical protein
MKLAILRESDGLLLGFEVVAVLPNPMPPGRAPGGDGDLAPGRYKWNGHQFIPLAPRGPDRDIGHEPAALRAIWLGFRAIQNSGLIDLPPDTVEWIDWYRRTIDAN